MLTVAVRAEKERRDHNTDDDNLEHGKSSVKLFLLLTAPIITASLQSNEKAVKATPTKPTKPAAVTKAAGKRAAVKDANKKPVKGSRKGKNDQNFM